MAEIKKNIRYIPGTQKHRSKTLIRYYEKCLV
jgi:hypothetical protein